MTNETVSATKGAHFSTAHLAGNLKARSVRGGAATFAAQGAKFCLNIASTVILARLLAPQDYGLIAMVTSVTGFIAVFKDLGLSMATVQKAEIDHAQVSTLFWINLLLSAALTLVTFLLAPTIASFYGDPRLKQVAAVLSIAFIFGGLTVQHQALLRRQMRLAVVAAIDVASMAVGIVTAISCAEAGLGYWALIWMQISTAAATAVGVWVASGWKPGLPVPGSGVRFLLAFGGHLTGFNLINYFARNMDNVLIGRYCGAQQLGWYAKSYSLLLFPIGQIVAPLTSVAVPALSQLQREPDRYRHYYLKAVTIIAYLSFPLVIALTVMSREIVELVLGTQWLSAAPIFMILAVGALLQPVCSTVGWIYISLGQTRRMFTWSCMVVPLIVLSFLLGLPWGAIGVAAGYSICNCLLALPEFAFALKLSPISLGDVISVIHRPLALSVVMAGGMVITRALLVDFDLISVISATSFAGCILFLTIARMVKSIRNDVNEILSSVKLVFAKQA